ncbi:hypothetical protein LTR72_006525 [Exophiala xenobiotica]|nr:hypothetical protein LTR72_006525 [Exophiala xenobiotica]KAK5295303.1 hypothetical protein LTR14_004473 [Exophiala xenobiotica]KAK5474404.1 hypothetical protein LTR55_009901 [Exophiala xenobiotica]
MAPNQPDNQDLKFIMSCLKHFDGEFKPDFEEVAKDVGATSGNSCYQRLRALKKRWDIPATLNPSSAGGRKRKGATTKDTADTAEGGAKNSAPKKKTRKTGKEAAGPVDQKDGTEVVVDVEEQED